MFVSDIKSNELKKINRQKQIRRPQEKKRFVEIISHLITKKTTKMKVRYIAKFVKQCVSSSTLNLNPSLNSLD